MKIYIILVKLGITNLLCDLLEDIGVEPFTKKYFNIDLSGFNFAPFYGCYIIRPSDALGMTKNPEKHSLDIVIESTGAQSTDYAGKTKCCGFPILQSIKNSLKMVAPHTGDAKTMVQMQW